MEHLQTALLFLILARMAHEDRAGNMVALLLAAATISLFIGLSEAVKIEVLLQ